MTALTNSFEGGSNGVTITTGNSGGASGNAFDSTGIGAGATLAFDNTEMGRGSLSCKVAAGGSPAASYAIWSTTFGTAATAWFRSYLFFLSNPAANQRVYAVTNAAGSTLCAAVYVTTAGKLLFADSAVGTIFTTATSVPLNAPFRIEGFVTGSASTGQVQLKLFTSPDSTVPAETQTSAASQNTSGTLGQYWFGQSDSSVAGYAYWQDDIGLSSTGYLGPVIPPSFIPPPVVVPPGFLSPAAFAFANRPFGVADDAQHPTAAPPVDATAVPAIFTTFPAL